MSLLTKIFVVIVAVLSVALVAMVMSFVANTQNWKDSYDRELKGKDAAVAAANAADARATQAARRLNDRESELKGQLEQLSGQISASSAAAAEARASLQTEQARIATMAASLARLESAVTLQTQISNSQQKELDQRRESMVTLQRQIIELADANNDKQGQLEALDRERRRLSEQLTLAEQTNTKNEEILRKLPPDMQQAKAEGAGAETPYEPASAIRGQVTAVQKFDDLTLVQINVGRRDGVGENMKFLVYRDNQFLGNLIITRVDDKAAAGRMAFTQAPITKGDSVLTGTSF